MRLEITPYESVGPIRFGMSRDEVRLVIGGCVAEFLKSEDAIFPADDFVGLGIHVYYRYPGTCEAVEMTSPAEPILSGRHLLGVNFSELREWLAAADPQLEVDDSGLTSPMFGIGLFAPYALVAPQEPVEGVIAFERGYYG